MLFSKIIEKQFAKVLGRYDGDPALYYGTPEEYPGLVAEPFDVTMSEGTVLRGFFYYYGAFDPERLIVFDHGIGAGHRAYMREIAYLAEHNYTVYSYDHTGCVMSDGTGIHGFAQGVADLDRVLTVLQADSRFANVPRKIMGHSWGGYSCMNVAALHPEVTHVVSLAGFVSARLLCEQYVPNPFLKYVDEVMDRERQHNPQYADMDARKSLKKAPARALHIQSKDDSMVKFNLCYELLAQNLGEEDGVEFIEVDGLDHNPQRTKAAVEALGVMQKDLAQKHKKHALDTKEQQDAFRAAYDWKLITEQDSAMWEKIFAFLEK